MRNTSESPLDTQAIQHKVPLQRSRLTLSRSGRSVRSAFDRQQARVDGDGGGSASAIPAPRSERSRPPLAAGLPPEAKAVLEEDAWLWRAQSRVAFAVMGLAAFLAVVYLAMTPGPHRAGLMTAATAVTVLAAAGVLASESVAHRGWRTRLTLASTLSAAVVLSVFAHFDGGLESPFLAFATLPVMFSALLLQPRAVAATGAMTVAALVAVGVSDSDLRDPGQSVLLLCGAIAGAITISVLTAVYRSRHAQAQLRFVDELKRLAACDSLTGCWNQATFQRRLREEVERSQHHHRPLSLMVIDVDLFKTFNDTCGREHGDAALCEIATTLQAAVRAQDLVARVGGDEFAVILPETDARQATELARHLLDATSAPPGAAGATLSIGVAQLNEEWPTANLFFRAADVAMFDAKAAGRSRVMQAGPRERRIIDGNDTGADSRRLAEVARQERRDRLQTERLFDAVLEEAPLGFALVDHDFRVVRGSGALPTIAGNRYKDSVGKVLADILPEAWAEMEPRYRQVLESGVSVRNLEVDGLTGDGQHASRLINLFPVHTGPVVTSIGVVSIDITDRKRLEQAQEHLTDAVVGALAAAVEARDPYTAGHQDRVSQLASAIAVGLGVDEWSIRGIALAASIHDIGKVAIPAEILSRPGALSDEELRLVRTHSRAGYNMVEGIDFPWPVAEMILQHHERLDGSGYPDGLRDKEILLGSRIVAVADVVEAISSHRPYRPTLGPDAALEVIEEGSGRAFDPDVVAVAARIIRQGAIPGLAAR